jgi:SAM-dependent methyltransferase
MIWVIYARFEGSPRQQKALADVFRRVCAGINTRAPGAPVRLDEVSSKKELFAVVGEIRAQGAFITEWHMVGSGTPYGPLLGSAKWPEEVSASDWSGMQLPFREQAKAWFYMEDSDAWLSPFIASTCGITAYGCRHAADISAMRAFSPGFWEADAGYDPVAKLYAEVFSDITVRRDECRWLRDMLLRTKPRKVLDIGCGNGALLAYLSGLIEEGAGVDISAEAVAIAAKTNRHLKNLSFTVIGGPRLPYPDGSFDAVVSMLSFRYLDWDPILEEIKRVLAPGGRLLIVDMVASAPKPYEWPAVMTDKLRSIWFLKARQSYKKALRKLVAHPAWRRMVEHHPMRGKKEFTLYLKSRFPGGRLRVLNRGARASVLAFDSGPVA